MKKNQLTQLLVDHPLDASEFNSALITEITRILFDPSMQALPEDADLPEEIITALQKVVTTTASNWTNTSFLKALSRHVFIDNLGTWNMKETDGAKLETCAHTLQLMMGWLKDGEKHKAVASPTQIHAVSRHFFHMSVAHSRNLECGQNAWIHALLNHVVRGEQDQAESVLKIHPEIATFKGSVIDCGKHKMFCTAFQYAVWAGDWNMYHMLQSYLSSDEVDRQLKDLENNLLKNGSCNYGARFDFTPVLSAYQTFIAAATPVLGEGNRSDELMAEVIRLWGIVCQQQAKLPMHVLQQYFHPSRSFTMNDKYSYNINPPEFAEQTRPSSNPIKFQPNESLKFGDNAGIYRSNWENGTLLTASTLLQGSTWEWLEGVKTDFAALSKLANVIVLKHQHTFCAKQSNRDEMQATNCNL